MNGTKRDPSISYTRAYLSIGFRKLLFPIDVRLFLHLLPEEGYILEEGIAKGRRGFGAQLSITGNIATKGEFTLALNSERGFIGIDGPEPLSVADEIAVVAKLLQERLEVDLSSTASFHEFLADGSIKAGTPPLETFLQTSKAFSSVGKMGKALGEEVSLYGVRLASAGREPNQADFIDMRLEPNTVHTKNLYSFSAVYRRQAMDPVLDFAKTFADKLTGLVSALERRE